MGLSSLNAALSGLSMAQSQIDIISNNIANVGTPGFTRKIMPQSTQSIDGRSVGVRPETIIRQVDLKLSRDLWTQISATDSWNVQADYLGRVSEFHGPPDKEISFAAEITDLYNNFVALSDTPESAFLQSQAVNQAVDTANKINDYANLLTSLRNDVQEDIESAVNRANSLLDQIVSLNSEIAGAANIGRTTANTEDLRDEAIKELSSLIEVSFFQRGDGVLVVQTNQGAELASTNVRHLSFNPTPMLAGAFYPDSAAGLYVGNPVTDLAGAVDITATGVGGKLGGLIALRDEHFARQTAQLDELAHKMAMRFDDQGLRLFTNGAGLIPSDAPPDLSTDPETPVAYVGFAAQMQVNQAVLGDPSLLQTGTNGVALQAGSNEVVSRIIDHVFGGISHKEAIGALDLSAVAGGSLQTYLGLLSENMVEGGRDLSAFTSAADVIAAANGTLAPTSDTFRVTFEDPDLGLGPINVDIDLSAVDAGYASGSFSQDMIDYFNDYITGGIGPLTPAEQADLATMNVQLSVGANGQLVFQSQGDITIDGTNPANPMGTAGLTILGFAEGTTEATDPYFDIQIGNRAPERIYITPADTEVTLLSKLQSVTGLAVEDFTASADGFLRLRPGENYADPTYGGEIKITSGPRSTSGAGAGAVLVPDGINVVSALFGSFTAGPPAANVSPITSVGYGSEISDSDATTIAFREDYLGPGANISTGIVGAIGLADFAQKMINQQSQELIVVQSRVEDTESLQTMLRDRLLDQSGVNIDEELGNLIVVQQAYAAAARVITAVDESFQELLRALQ